MIIKATICALLLIFCINPNFGRIIKIGSTNPYRSIASARSVIEAGDTVMFVSGRYRGGEAVENLKGSSEAWITIMAERDDSVIIEGGSSAFHFTDAAYLRLSGFTFTSQTGNGINIDDGGSYDSPSHNIVITGCTWLDISATGNNDLLKMSGVNDFLIENCSFANGAKGGSMIDMVGCHRGVITGSCFVNGGSNSVQAKGGSSDIIIKQCRFTEAGERGINIGGSTGNEYFRPAGNSYEAERIKVWSNIFEGNGAAVAFTGSNDCEVINNTIKGSRMWVVRILQENRQPGMKKCSGNRFINNIVVFAAKGRPAINTGPETMPETFIFSNNLWYNPGDTSFSSDGIPGDEINGNLNADPFFTDAFCSIGFDSPASGRGLSVSEPEKDFSGKPFAKIRSIGAMESSIRESGSSRPAYRRE